MGDETVLTANQQYGIITSFSSRLDSIIRIPESDTHGEVPTPVTGNYIKVYFTRLPKAITSLNDELDSVVQRNNTNILVHYICARALEDNADTQSQRMSARYLNLYLADKNRLESNRSMNNVEASRQTSYVGGFSD